MGLKQYNRGDRQLVRLGRLVFDPSNLVAIEFPGSAPWNVPGVAATVHLEGGFRFHITEEDWAALQAFLALPPDPAPAPGPDRSRLIEFGA